MTWSLCLASYPILALSLPVVRQIAFLFSVNGSAHSHPSCPQEPIIGCVKIALCVPLYNVSQILSHYVAKIDCSPVKVLVTDTYAIISGNRCTTKCVIVAVCTRGLPLSKFFGFLGPPLLPLSAFWLDT